MSSEKIPFETFVWDTKRRSVARIEFDDERAECRALQVESTPKGRKVTVVMEPGDDWQRLKLVLPDGSTVEIRGSDWYWVDVRRPDGSLAGFVATETTAPEPLA